MEQKEQSLRRLRQLSEEIKSRLDYRSFYLRYCADARTSGSRLQTLCPIPTHSHSGKGHPSLSIDLQRGLFHCFSRDEGGDAIRFYELMRNVSFSQAVRRERQRVREAFDKINYSVARQVTKRINVIERRHAAPHVVPARFYASGGRACL